MIEKPDADDDLEEYYCLIAKPPAQPGRNYECMMKYSFWAFRWRGRSEDRIVTVFESWNDAGDAKEWKRTEEDDDLLSRKSEI